MPDTDERPSALRPTRQRLAITDALRAAVDFQSAQEIHDSLRQGGDKVGLATVYRTLQAMADAGDVDVRHNPAGEATYRRCSTSHHHHLVCRSCGRTVEITGAAVEKWAHAVADEHAFVDVTHTVELVGLCADCAASTTN